MPYLTSWRSPHLRLGLQSSLFLSVFPPPKPCMHNSCLPKFATRPAHLILLGLGNFHSECTFVFSLSKFDLTDKWPNGTKRGTKIMSSASTQIPYSFNSRHWPTKSQTREIPKSKENNSLLPIYGPEIWVGPRDCLDALRDGRKHCLPGIELRYHRLGSP